MPLSDQEYRDLIIVEVGDNAAGLLAANIATLWEVRDTIADSYQRYLAVKIAAIDLMLANAARSPTSFTAIDGTQVNYSDVFNRLKLLREVALSAAAAASGGGSVAIGEMTQTAPIMRDLRGQSDPNARAKRGDPLKGW